MILRISASDCWHLLRSCERHDTPISKLPRWLDPSAWHVHMAFARAADNIRHSIVVDNIVVLYQPPLSRVCAVRGHKPPPNGAYEQCRRNPPLHKVHEQCERGRKKSHQL